MQDSSPCSSTFSCLQEVESNESSSDDSDVEEILFEEEIEVDGEKEVVLVPSQAGNVTLESSTPSTSISPVDIFKSIIIALKKENLIKRSPKGQTLGKVLDALEKMAAEKVQDVSSDLLTRLSKCINDARRYKLPSSFQTVVWSSFHDLRCNQSLLDAWNAFIHKNIPDAKEGELCLQLVMDRMLKSLIKAQSKTTHRNEANGVNFRSPHTPKQLNTIRYMAGYVAAKLLKKYKKKSKHPQVQVKRDIFVRVLRGMKAVNQPGEPDSPLEYTRYWSRLIDRGGLYHIKDDVFLFFELIERIVGQHISIDSIRSYVPGDDLARAIHEDILSSPPVLFSWEKLAESIPVKYEKYYGGPGGHSTLQWHRSSESPLSGIVPVVVLHRSSKLSSVRHRSSGNASSFQ